MRQNINDIKPVFLQSKQKTILKNGLMINFNLEKFSFDKINLEQNKSIIQFNDLKDVNVKAFKNQNKKINFEFFENKFDDFHHENVQDGLIITIPKNKKIPEALQIKQIIKSNNSLFHIKIIVGQNSEITIIDVLEDDTETEGYNSKVVELLAEKNSVVNYFHIQRINNKKIHYSKKLGIAMENSELNWDDFNLGGKVILSDTKTILSQSNSKTTIKSIFFSDGKQQFNIAGQAIHRSKKTLSKVIGKGAVKEDSKSLYRGNIHMEKNAHKAEGTQRADILILDSESEADAIPQLLIDNNNVKCSHAVTIGRIDTEKLFYLMSRGLTEEESKNWIVKGFFNTTIKDIKNERVTNNLQKEIEGKMSR
ncbi:MAG: Fe-S cluster assembly protein SufD [archaeon]